MQGVSHQPLVICSDMSGEITAVGSGVSAWAVGDRVMGTFNQTHLTGQIKEHHMAHGVGLPLEGVLQDYRLFPETGLVKVPDFLSDEQASCLPIAALTAWMAINWMRPLGQSGGNGEVVLVQGTGGVSISGLQIAKASGATSKFSWNWNSVQHTVDLTGVAQPLSPRLPTRNSPEQRSSAPTTPSTTARTPTGRKLCWS